MGKDIRLKDMKEVKETPTKKPIDSQCKTCTNFFSNTQTTPGGIILNRICMVTNIWYNEHTIISNCNYHSGRVETNKEGK